MFEVKMFPERRATLGVMFQEDISEKMNLKGTRRERLWGRGRRQYRQEYKDSIMIKDAAEL